MMPIFDPVISYGALVSVLGSLFWAVGLWYALTYKVKRLEERNEEAHARAAEDRKEVKESLALSEAELKERADKFEEKLDRHGELLNQIAVQDERLKAFDLRLAQIYDELKTVTMARNWPRPRDLDRLER